MPSDTTRRGVIAGALAAGIGGLTFTGARELLEQFAPLSGRAWDAADRTPSSTVESPYGEATLRFDADGVPHVEADDEAAAYFAVGYAQAFDRLFQLDLQRRVMRGQLSEVVGEATLEDDEFHARMDFAGAAEATWEHVAETPAGRLVEAYADGVNRVIETEQLPLEFELLDYEPREWTPVDSMLMEKQISWDLTGNFGELRTALVADRLDEGVAEDLYPERMDHDVPILREEVLESAERLDGGGDEANTDAADASGATTASIEGGSSQSDERERGADPDAAVGAGLTRWLSKYESPTGVGSNSWVVSGEHTESGLPIVAYDPHLTLMAPPLWYEQRVETPERSVRGATFPGVPFVIAGANDAGTWSFTNVGADVLDCYAYEIDDDGERYRYDGEWREFETELRTLDVAGGDDRDITLRKTVHGPLLEREGRTVGVAWTGHTATRTTEAIEEYGRSEGLEDLLESTRKFDLPTQNLVYADADGRTLYYATGKLPIREIDGEAVAGNRIFDGSAGEGEWEGFTPFGESSWDGFVPFAEKPHAIDANVLATANQRVVDDPEHYVGVDYAAPYRGARIYDRLDAALEGAGDDGGDAPGSTDLEFHRKLQADAYDLRADQLLPELLAALADADADTDGRLEDAAATLEGWDRGMDRDSEGALVFARWMDHFRRLTVEPQFADADLDESHYPGDWAVATLDDDSDLYDDRSRAETMVAALEAALEELDDEGWERYGDWNTTRAIEHPFAVEAPFFDYDERPLDGSRATVNNYRVASGVGASWRMVVEPGGDATAILPGGNSGDYFSAHYGDQLDRWIENEQKPMERETDADVAVEFTEGSS
ncbi:penicillin acylase family protein [Natronolimnohabitans innermongolicus]|uniref:Peptidase S45 penicillin amidase n=1 Tax=Natronolimnohabitans innermongolicus JCM 12255 TaxID=1227499 RepID=L9XN25_9EURY|nr:penicillin acylase family protein [Natronolimnohabitans innermongolicus]ELY62033.1 peptidase S45 penicillin amidase [Natronolimnohabitans innermongolicus JCM 12255]